MKALLVADSDYILDSFNNFFLENGYDTICYNWLLKALDNIEEIRPHVVLINSIDYPRHWKILVQHIYSYIDASALRIILVTADTFADDEHKKAEALNVFCVSSNMNEEVKEQLLGLLELKQDTSPHSNEKTESKDSRINTEKDSVESSVKNQPVMMEHPLVDLEVETANNVTDIVEQENESTEIYFTFKHPHTQIWINGTVDHYNHPIILFTPLDSTCLETIRFGKKIEHCILSVDGVESQINVQVQGIEGGTIEFCAVR